MLQTRVLWSLTRYFGLLTLLFTAVLLIPGIGEGIFATPGQFVERLIGLVKPLPELWRVILPTVFMLTVLVALSRLGFSGDVKIWRAAGTSSWPFAGATAVFGACLGAMMMGPLWTFSQPEAANLSSTAQSHYLASDGHTWSAVPNVGSTMQAGYMVLHGTENAVLRAQVTDPLDKGGALSLGPGWIARGDVVTPFSTLELTRSHGETPRQWIQGTGWDNLAYRLSYPVLLVGLGLLMLPIALSIDGQRLTVIKIVGASLLALNTLFVLLMTDAMAKAGLWSEVLFYPVRAAIVLVIGLLALLLVEERTA